VSQLTLFAKYFEKFSGKIGSLGAVHIGLLYNAQKGEGFTICYNVMHYIRKEVVFVLPAKAREYVLPALVCVSVCVSVCDHDN